MIIYTQLVRTSADRFMACMPIAKAENCVALEVFETSSVRPWNTNPVSKSHARVYSPLPLKVYVLPSRVVMCGSPKAQAAT